ncbi:MAG: outer membrane beta-barrel protein [Pseudomonadota bacterium]
MKNLSVILLVIVSLSLAGFAEAAPKKRTRNANRVGAYGGALIGNSRFSGDQSANEQGLADTLTGQGVPIQNLSTSTEDSAIGYQATFGYRFNRFFAAELGLAQFGSLKSTARAEMNFGGGFVPASLTLKFSAGGPIISAIGILPINEKFELYGRLGYLFTSSERTLSSRVDGQSGSFGSAKGDSQNPVYGLGFAWHFNQVYSVRGEFQKLDNLGQDDRTGEENLTIVGVGITVRF